MGEEEGEGEREVEGEGEGMGDKLGALVSYLTSYPSLPSLTMAQIPSLLVQSDVKQGDDPERVRDAL